MARRSSTKRSATWCRPSSTSTRKRWGCATSIAIPDGRYTLTKEIICDPHHSVVLQHVRLEGHEDLLPRLKVYALLAPHLDGGGAGNTARALDVAGHKMLLAWKNQWSLAMGASCGFSRVSCGFVGASDGWRDLMDNFQMDWEFGSATNGNVAVMGELNLGAAGTDGAREFTLAIGLGEGTPHGAAEDDERAGHAVRAASRRASSSSGTALANPEWLAAKARDGGKLMRASHNVLLAHEDKTYSGAFVASASIPWGQAQGRRRPGRLSPGVDARHGADGDGAAGLRARGDGAAGAGLSGLHAAARRRICAEFLGRRDALLVAAMQLDEVAFPIILAWRLWKANGLGEMDIFPFVERAAGFLVRHAPITHQERWEENAGYSPSTLAAVIGG